MAQPVDGEELSLVPYTTRESNEIFLSHNNAVVVYDPRSKQLMLRDTSTSSTAMALTKCPTCQRPFGGGDMHENSGLPSPSAGVSADDVVESGFVNPRYFRMLQDITDGSHHATSGPSSSGPPGAWAQSIDDGTSSSSNSSSSDSASPLPTNTEAELVSSTPVSPGATQGISSTAFSPNYFKRFFVEEGELGRGGKGVVLLVKHLLDGVFLGHFACKRVPVGDDHAWLEKVLVEVQLLQHLSHQNLVSYRHVWLEDVQFTKFGPSVPCAFILQQYCNAGDLHRYICRPRRPQTPEELKGRMRRRSKGQLEQIPPNKNKNNNDIDDDDENSHHPRRLSFDEIYSFFRDIASGLKYLHSNGFIHRDLKPSNCLLHETGGGEIRVLVSDFGEAQSESMARKSTGTTGTISYCAPEVLREQYPGGPLGEFSAKSDIFSLGMILYFMCFASLPYVHHHPAADGGEEDEPEDVEGLKEEISRWGGFEFDEDDAAMGMGMGMGSVKGKGKIGGRKDLPDKLYKFLKRLLALDPAERPSAEEILRAISTGSGLTDQFGHGHGIPVGVGGRNPSKATESSTTTTTTTTEVITEDENGIDEPRPGYQGSWWRGSGGKRLSLSPSPMPISPGGVSPSNITGMGPTTHSSHGTTTMEDGSGHHRPPTLTPSSDTRDRDRDKNKKEGSLILRRSSSNNPSLSPPPSIIHTTTLKGLLPPPTTEPSTNENGNGNGNDDGRNNEADSVTTNDGTEESEVRKKSRTVDLLQAYEQMDGESLELYIQRGQRLKDALPSVDLDFLIHHNFIRGLADRQLRADVRMQLALRGGEYTFEDATLMARAVQKGRELQEEDLEADARRKAGGASTTQSRSQVSSGADSSLTWQSDIERKVDALSKQVEEALTMLRGDPHTRFAPPWPVRPPTNNSCFNCGDPNHWVRSCPYPSTRQLWQVRNDNQYRPRPGKRRHRAATGGQRRPIWADDSDAEPHQLHHDQRAQQPGSHDLPSPADDGDDWVAMPDGPARWIQYATERINKTPT
ncbi:MAG: hypothetical protein M1823_003202 [Watsoniomyces obsoletus]|nr:MAG: hypothetical protein M1823_003202 [Watsoniomyces obsoletus]